MLLFLSNANQSLSGASAVPGIRFLHYVFLMAFPVRGANYKINTGRRYNLSQPLALAPG